MAPIVASKSGPSDSSGISQQLTDLYAVMCRRFDSIDATLRSHSQRLEKIESHLGVSTPPVLSSSLPLSQTSQSSTRNSRPASVSSIVPPPTVRVQLQSQSPQLNGSIQAAARKTVILDESDEENDDDDGSDAPVIHYHIPTPQEFALSLKSTHTTLKL